ncbi:DegA family transcriptional regulator [Neobacillus bataviensis LMG 21833]|uniref:DegA family transcriptional regulator n=1 Tax=Neobacillus bataviensis LMG 21833 TaxID=1117379 RepID=K6DB30_9BACI|nr:LacI family DNA-binding transcriptional regulator [Neobacillus bataviensis]EKN69747.1 DegA family transcriptional regulator [Neobacillus bataviensis LMG 21833]
MATIADVAKKTGLSITTISRALNNHPYVSDKTKKLIFDTMEEMDFYPNSVAQQLRGKSTKLIGVVISYITNPFFAYLVDAIEREAYERGFQVVVLQTLEDPKRELTFIDMLKKKQLDGILMTNTENDTEIIKKYLLDGRIVMCNRYIGNEKLPIIHIDEKQATYEAIKHLLEKGYRKIAYCTGSNYHKNDHRYEGYLQALSEYNLEFDEDYYFSYRLNIKDGQRTLHDIVALKEKMPDAVFANGDEVGAGIISEAPKLGIKIPKDLAVVGFDDQPIAEVLHPSLTTVRQPIKEMGKYAADVLISKLLDEDPPKPIELRTTLIIRETT